MIPCKICGTPTTSFRIDQMNILFHECSFCEFIFKDESHYITEEKELEKYDMHHNDDDNIGYVNFLTNFVDAAVMPYIKSGSALDFGSGPNPVLSRILSEKYPFQVDIYDLHYSKDKIYESKKYQLITSTEVVEHLANPLEYFELFHSLLLPKGILSIMTLFYPKDKKQFANWFYIRDVTHLSFFTPKTLEQIAKLVGFQMIYTNEYRYAVFLKK